MVNWIRDLPMCLGNDLRWGVGWLFHWEESSIVNIMQSSSMACTVYAVLDMQISKLDTIQDEG